MSAPRWICAVALGAWAWLGPGGLAPVQAQSASEIAAAKQWFSDGLALEEKGDFAAALGLFKKAMDVKKTPQIVFHVALCELKTGALVEALVDFERAVEIAKSESNDQVEAAANAELASLRPRVPLLELSVTGAEKPTRVLLDGQEISTATLGTPMPVNPGKHRVVGEFAGGKSERAFEVAERGKASIALEAPAATAPAPSAAPAAPQPAAPSAAPASAAPSASPPASPEADRGSSNALPWVVVGGGVLLTAGGFYLWKLRGDQKDELDSICPEPDQCPRDRADDVDDLQGKGQTYTTLAIGMWALGGAALATGGFLALSAGDEKSATARVAPALGRGLAGAVVAGRF